MQRLVTVVAALLLVNSAFAAKVHRESKKEIQTKIPTASGDIKKVCGCAPKVDVDWTTFDKTPADKAKDYKKNILNEFENIKKVSTEFCSDDDSKKLFCDNIKQFVVVSKGISEADAKHDAGKKLVQIFTSEQMHSGGFKLKSIMEGW